MNWSERDLEDWLWDHPEHFGTDFEWIGRQCQVGPWRLDLLGYEVPHNNIYVVELKACKAKPRDLVQLMRYVSGLKQASRSLPDAGTIGMVLDRINGLLVAPAFTEDVIGATQWSTNITCFGIEKAGNEFVDVDPGYNVHRMAGVRSCAALSTWFPTLEPDIARDLMHY